MGRFRENHERSAWASDNLLAQAAQVRLFTIGRDAALRKLADFVPSLWGPSPVTGRSRCDYTVPGDQVEGLAGRRLSRGDPKAEPLPDVGTGRV